MMGEEKRRREVIGEEKGEADNGALTWSFGTCSMYSVSKGGIKKYEKKSRKKYKSQLDPFFPLLSSLSKSFLSLSPLLICSNIAQTWPSLLSSLPSSSFSPENTQKGARKRFATIIKRKVIPTDLDSRVRLEEVRWRSVLLCERGERIRNRHEAAWGIGAVCEKEERREEKERTREEGGNKEKAYTVWCGIEETRSKNNTACNASKGAQS